MCALKREVGLVGATAYTVGIIVGAGVYALIGRAAGYAGNSVWLSFVLAAFIASFTGLSYAELTAAFPVSGGEYVYMKESFGSKFWAFIVGWLVLLTGVVSSAAVALGFGGYLRTYVNLPEVVPAIIIIALFSIVNFWGIRESIAVNVALTAAEVLGLILIIAFGVNYFGSVNYVEAPLGVGGIIVATGLIFFAFTGFESIAKIGEETKNPKKTLPKALILALIISTLLYVAVGVSVVGIIPYEQLAASSAPFADVALKAQGPQAATILSIIALLSTANTVLIILISTSRITYGIAKESSLPKFLTRIHPSRRTPWIAILLIMVASIGFALIRDIELIANVTNFVTFIVFFTVNLALINLYRHNRVNKSRVSKVLAIKNVPALAVLGAILSFAMLFQFDLLISAIALLLVVVGALIYMAVGKVSKKRIDEEKEKATQQQP